MGDPSGIGPEIIVRALALSPPELRARCVFFGDPLVLARAGGLPQEVEVVATSRLSEEESRPGRPTLAGGAAQVACLEMAAVHARQGKLGALVTAPISKAQARAAGFPFPGHTEFLAARLGAAEHAMMFVGPRLRVVLSTIHVPLAEVGRALSSEAVGRAIYLGGRSLAMDFGIDQPRIGVVALNPHAGESGLLGNEEELVISPGMVIGRSRLEREGIAATLGGPLVPDAAFRAAVHGAWDLLVAMYHDQALIPIKLVDFDSSVNMTLGLPIVRTSPDHGVGYDIAGTGVARHESFKAALDLAFTLAAHVGRISHSD